MKDNLEQLLPHKKPMLLLDKVLEKTDDYVCCQVVVNKQRIFYDPELNGMAAWIAIELMAQAIGVFAGLHHYPAAPELGLLLSVRKFSSQHPYYKLGSVLIVVAKKNYWHDRVAVFDCEILVEDKIITTATLNTIVPPQDKITAILQGKNL